MTDINITVTGPVTVWNIDPAPIVGPILTRIDALEANVTAPLTNIDEALAALQAKAADLATAEAADRAAFDSLATVVRAFVASVQTTGALTADQQATAQAILDSLGATQTSDETQAADEASLQAEVPATDAPAEPTA